LERVSFFFLRLANKKGVSIVWGDDQSHPSIKEAAYLDYASIGMMDILSSSSTPTQGASHTYATADEPGTVNGSYGDQTVSQFLPPRDEAVHTQISLTFKDL